jgi:hypothetical protein
VTVDVGAMVRQMTVAKMPRGICHGCGTEEYLPPFGEGLCFLCATDGPPNNRSCTGSALGEDADARRATGPSDRDLRIHDEVQAEFDGHQGRWARAIGSAHYRSQRFTTWVPVARRERRQSTTGQWGPTVEELQARVERNRREDEARRERSARIVRLKIMVEARLAAPADYARKIGDTKQRRGGSGNYASAEKIAAAVALREKGKSIRCIVRETGLSKATVSKYVPWIDRPQSARLMHERWKHEGRPMLPPWRRS